MVELVASSGATASAEAADTKFRRRMGVSFPFPRQMHFRV
jgi:hypothetical protein